jgi:hypothetical protein
MDWKYKRFYQERLFPAPADETVEAARRYFSESLGWRIDESVSAVTARGASFSHSCIAHLSVEPTAGGTRARIELLVERASPLGFMLVDVGGYYSIQIGHWFEGVQWYLGQQRLANHEKSSVPHSPPVIQTNKPAACIFNGCLVLVAFTFGLYAIFLVVTAFIGLLTGNLLLIGRSESTNIHGIWARIVSVIILTVIGSITWRITKTFKRSKPRILG